MRSSVRWLVPVAVAATVAGGVAVSSAQAGSTPELPQRTPQQVLAAVAGSSVTALEGTVVTRADVGLPDVSALGGSGSGAADASDPAGLLTRFLTGKNTLRVWVDGPTKQRAQLVDPFSELDVVRNGTDLWTYTSRGNAVQHGTLPAHPAARPGATPSPSATGTGTAADLTPDQLAERAIAAADPTTAVTLGEPALVAGRNTYTLTLTPKTDATLVGRIVIAVDAEKGVPLRVQVFPRGKAQAAIETGFTAVDFGTPDAARFTFTPPAGATVTPLKAPTTPSGSTTGPSLPAAARPTVTGTGWASVVEIPAAALQQLATVRAGSSGPAASSSASPDASDASGRSAAAAQGLAALDQLTTPVADGGRAISTSLVSVLLTKDGRVLAGAVPVQTLVDAAAK